MPGSSSRSSASETTDGIRPSTLAFPIAMCSSLTTGCIWTPAGVETRALATTGRARRSTSSRLRVLWLDPVSRRKLKDPRPLMRTGTRTAPDGASETAISSGVAATPVVDRTTDSKLATVRIRMVGSLDGATLRVVPTPSREGRVRFWPAGVMFPPGAMEAR